MKNDNRHPKPDPPATAPGWELAYEAEAEKMITFEKLENRLMKLSDVLGSIAYLMDRTAGGFILEDNDEEEMEVYRGLAEILRMSQEKLSEIAPALPNPKADYIPTKRNTDAQS